MLDTPHYRERLQAELDELMLSIGETTDSAATVELDQTRVGRLSRMDAMQQQAMAQGTRTRMLGRVRQIDAALARIDSGQYGHCCACQETLSPERLNANPAVVFCADCAKEREQGR